MAEDPGPTEGTAWREDEDETGRARKFIDASAAIYDRLMARFGRGSDQDD